MDVTEAIQELLWDKRYEVIPDHIESPFPTVLLRDLNIEDQNFRIFQKKKFRKLAIDQGVRTEDEIISDARMGGIWTEDDEDVFSKGEEHIKFLEGEIERHKRLRAKVKKLKKAVKDTKAKIRLVRDQRDRLVMNSADYYAHEQSIYAVLPRVALKEDGTPLWDSDEAYLACKSQYPNFCAYLGHRLVIQDLWQAEKIRRVAKNAEWRLIWNAGRENIAGLFRRPLCDFNLNQKMLLYWSRVYDSVYEDPECPEADIIDDDEKLDDWLANRDIKRKEDKSSSTKDKKFKTGNDHHERMMILDGYYVEDCTCGALSERGKGLGEIRKHDDVCQYGTWRDYTREEKDEIAERIYGRNPAKIRGIMNSQQAAVEKRGTVEEHHLRDRKSREMIGAKTNVIPVYKR
jgi:hypothetical protein